MNFWFSKARESSNQFFFSINFKKLLVVHKKNTESSTATLDRVLSPTCFDAGHDDFTATRGGLDRFGAETYSRRDVMVSTFWHHFIVFLVRGQMLLCNELSQLLHDFSYDIFWLLCWLSTFRVDFPVLFQIFTWRVFFFFQFWSYFVEKNWF